MKLEHVYTAFWLAWGVMFLAIEIPAIRRKRRGGTLTDHVMWLKRWRVKGIPVGYTVFTAFWLWLTAHFFLEI
jgi:hypothetical protein